MWVRMLVSQRIQEAGRERCLDEGREYDLADPVGLSLVVLGFAAAASAPTADVRETKPERVPENGRRRRR